MVLSFLYLGFRALLGALVRSRGGLVAKDVELLVLAKPEVCTGVCTRRASAPSPARLLRVTVRF